MTRSLVEDHDLDLRNQRQQVPNLHLIISPITRRIATRFSSGFAFLFAPFLYLAEHTKSLFPAFADATPYIQNETIPFAHALALFVGSVLFGFATLLISYLLLSRKENSRAGPVLITLGLFFGTPLAFYTFTMPSYAHAADAFLVAIAFFLALFAPPIKRLGISVRNLLLGIMLGLSVLLRNNNVVLIPPLLIALLIRTRPTGSFFTRQTAVTLMEIVLGATPFLVLFVTVNISQYGRVIATGYEVQWREWYLLKMLFHPYVSIFLWSPVTVLGMAGLIAGTMKKNIPACTALCCVFLVFLTVQFQPNWWGGCSFGSRFFTHLFIFWVWGVLEFFVLLRRTAPILLTLCALWTVFLFHVSFINSASPDFRVLLRSNYCRRTPIEMFRSAAKDYHLAVENGETTNAIQYWLQSTRKGNFPTVLSLLTQ